MKNVIFLLGALLITALFAFSTSKPNGQTEVASKQKDGSFALLELFTSQGCSSCPPADEQLALFDQRAQSGEAIYALSYHVDYWNYLGWKDPFSDARFSDRQRNYAAKLGSRVYTPQLVVNGQAEMIGSRRGETTAAVRKALNTKREHVLEISIDTLALESQQYKLNYKLSGGALPADAQLVVVGALSEATSQVKRGENSGRKLTHINVVRSFEKQPIQGVTGSMLIHLHQDLMRQPHKIIAFVQQGDAGEIMAVAKVDFSGLSQP